MGIEIEAGVGIAIGNEIRAGFSSLANTLDEGRNSVRKTLSASGIMPASGALLLGFDGPAYGSLWCPVWVTVYGGDDHTAVANSSVAVYVGGTCSLTPSYSNLVVPATTATLIPWYYKFGKDTLYAETGDSVYLLVYGAAAGSQIGAALRVREVRPSYSEEKLAI